jgi:curli biogenesis system outer membrane secretion channel CsgG
MRLIWNRRHALIRSVQTSTPPLSTFRRLTPVVLLPVLFGAFACAPRAMRGGEGTANPDMDVPAMSVELDREDINFLVGEFLAGLEASRFWRQTVESSDRPLVAVWPISNQSSIHIDDQMTTLLSSIETALVNTGDVRVVDRSRQQNLIAEIGMQQGAAFDQSSAQRLGKQLGVRYFVTGRITSVDERIQRTRRVQYSLFLQVIEIETGIIEFQSEVTRSKAIRR